MQSDNAFVNTFNESILRLQRTVSIIVMIFFVRMMTVSRHTIACMLSGQSNSSIFNCYIV
jgi:hypothetical protein